MSGTKSIIADNLPKKVKLKAGDLYHFCTCGRSKNQPACDGSHSGTDFKPIAYKPEIDEDKMFCICKQSSKLPFCDGTHNEIDEHMVGTEGKPAEI